MEMQLDNFMSKIKILNKDLAVYKDEESIPIEENGVCKKKRFHTRCKKLL